MDAQIAEFPLMDQPVEAPRVDSSFELARSGDLWAFRQLVRLHQARVFSIALRLTGRRADAEELAQDVFVQLHRALPQITNAQHMVHWLLRTVSHRCIDRMRQQERRPRLVPIETLREGTEPAAPEMEHDPLAGASLRRLVTQLQPDARAVVLLRFQEDLDPQDIAQMLEMSVNTVKSHLRRSLEWMRAQLGDSDGY